MSCRPEEPTRRTPRGEDISSDGLVLGTDLSATRFPGMVSPIQRYLRCRDAWGVGELLEVSEPKCGRHSSSERIRIPCICKRSSRRIERAAELPFSCIHPCLRRGGLLRDRAIAYLVSSQPVSPANANFVMKRCIGFLPLKQIHLPSTPTHRQAKPRTPLLPHHHIQNDEKPTRSKSPAAQPEPQSHHSSSLFRASTSFLSTPSSPCTLPCLPPSPSSAGTLLSAIS